MKQLKKLLCVLLCLVLCLSLMPAALAEDADVGAIKLVEEPEEAWKNEEEDAPTSGTCGDHLTWSYDVETCVLTITGTGDMWDWDESTGTPVPWRAYSNVIRAVALPDGLTSIGAHAFSFFLAMKNLTIPEGVTSIGDSAFYDCIALTSVAIPGSVTSIGANAFEYCSSLSTLTIPEGVTSIGERAFFGCSALTSVTIPEGVTSIKYYAFSSCYSLTSVTIPESVTSIEACAFWNCSALKNVKIPKGVTSIGEQAFSGCGMLASVWISENVTYIGDWAFGYDGNLKDVVFLGGPPVIETSSFCDVNANAYYPDDGSWAKANRKNYGGTLNWIPFTGEVVLNPFSDVKSGKYYYNAVLWAISQDPPITSGTSDTTFSPNQTCTRGQIVTFLWSAFGQPEPSDTDNPFEDVKAGKFYYKAVLWAVEKGITSGKDASHFAPNEPCSRCQVVTFLWNAYGKPEPSNTHNPFKDVTEGKYYYQAVLWAYYAGITSGIDTTHFGPDNTCTRGQVVTFLYSTRNIPKPE